MLNKIIKKSFFVFLSLNLLLQSIYPTIALADDLTPTPTPTVEVTPTPEATPSPTPEITPTPTAEVTPTAEITSTPTIEIIPTPEASPTAVPTPETGPVPTPTPNLETQWTFSDLVVDTVYSAPQNDKVQIIFSRLPDSSKHLLINEIVLTPEQVASIGAASNIAYEITSDMENDTFVYDLQLPLPETESNLDVEYAQSPDTLGETVEVTQAKEIKPESITIRGLNHFTVFIIIDDGDANFSAPTWSTHGTGYLGDHRWITKDKDNKKATWTFSGSEGIYKIYLSWTVWSDHATNATYEMPDDSTVTVNQKLLANGDPASNGTWSDWYDAGIFSLKNESDKVILKVDSSVTDGNLSADAVKFELVAPAEIWVDDDYNAGNNDGHTFGYDAFDNIQDAIDNIAPDGTIHVAAGNYNEEVTIPADLNGITLSGAGTGDSGTILTGSISNGSELSHINIQGFVIREGTDGVNLSDLHSSVITDNVFTDQIVSILNLTGDFTDTIIRYNDFIISGDTLHLLNGLTTSPLFSFNYWGSGIFPTPAIENTDADSSSIDINPWLVASKDTGKASELGYSYSSDDGNLTVTGEGTANLYVAQYPSTPSSGGLGTGFSSVSPYYDVVTENGVVTWPLRIEIKYDDTNLPSGVTESELKGIYYFDGSSWQLYSDTGVNTDDNFVWANADHLTPIVAGAEQDTTAPSAPDLVSPLDNAIVQGSVLTNSWTTVDDAVKYIYESYHNGTATSLRWHQEIDAPTTSKTATNVAETTFWWRVKAVDSAGNQSVWSPLWKVTIDNTKPNLINQTTFSGWYNADQVSIFTYEDTNGIVSGTPVACTISTEGENQTCFVPAVNVCDTAGNCNTDSVTSNGANIDKIAPSAPSITLPLAETYHKTSPILNQWSSVSDPSGIAYYRIEYSYDDGHTFSGAPYRTSTTTSRNHSPSIGEQGGVQFRVQAFDNSGNEGAWSEWRHYFYDSIAPLTPSLVSPASGSSINRSAAILDWTDVTDASPITYKYKSSWTGGSYGPVTTGANSYIDARGSADRVYNWQVQACDSAGNCSAWSGPWVITIDSTNPSNPGAPVTDPYITKLTSQDWTWTPSTDNLSGIAGYSLRIHDLIADSYTSWSTLGNVLGTTTNLTDGQYSVEIKSIDSAGNESGTVSSQTLLVDSILPTTPQVTQPIAGEITSNKTFKWSASTDSGSGLRAVDPYRYEISNVSDFSVLVRSNEINSTHTTQSSLPDGDYFIRVKSYDAADNSSDWSSVVDFTIDTVSPESTITSPEESSRFNSSIDIRGETTDKNIVSFVDLSFAPFSGEVCGEYSPITTLTPEEPIASYSWSYSWTPSSEGSFCIKANGTDSAGNVEHSAIISNITYDITSPTVSYLEPTPENGLLTNANDQTFRVSVDEPADSCTLNFNGSYVERQIESGIPSRDEGYSHILGHSDDSATYYDLPFSFPFYGNSYNRLSVSTNALLRFGSGPDATYSDSLSGLIGRIAIAPLWDDLVTTVYARSQTDSVRFRWEGSRWAAGGYLTNEAVLRSNGQIELHYGNVNLSGNTATVGISSGNGTDYLLSSMNGMSSTSPVSFLISSGITSSYKMTLDEDGTYHVDVTDISDGEINFSVECTDLAQNSGTSESRIFTVDTLAPQLSSQTSFEGWYSQPQTSLFNYQDENGIASGNDVSCVIETEGVQQTCSATPNVCDNAGNCNTDEVTSNPADIDLTDPESVITIPENEESGSTVYSNSWTGYIEGTSSDVLSGVSDIKVSIMNDQEQYWNGEGWQPGEEYLLQARPVVENWDNWSYTPGFTPEEGSFLITSHATDNSGRFENSYKLTIVFDKTIPEVTISVNPTDPDSGNGWYKTQPEITLTGTDTNFDRIEYQWDSKTGSWTAYSFPFKLDSEGSHTLYYRALDKAGNSSDIGVKNIKWDKTELVKGPQNLSINPNPTSGSDAKVTWEAGEDAVGLDRYEIRWSLIGGSLSYSAGVGTSTFEYRIDRLIEGRWEVVVDAVDGAGNRKGVSQTLVVDRTAPLPPILSLTGTGEGSVSLSWTKSDSATDYIIWYGTRSGERLYGARTGDVTSFTVRGLGAGSYYFIVKSVDSAQNQSAESNEVNTGQIGGAEGVEPNQPAEGFSPDVQGATTDESIMATPSSTTTPSVLGDSENQNGFSWKWLLLLLLLAVIYYRFKKKH